MYKIMLMESKVSISPEACTAYTRMSLISCILSKNNIAVTKVRSVGVDSILIIVAESS